MSSPVSAVDARYSKADTFRFEVGDRVSVACLIREGKTKDGKEKTRIQNFIGDVISIQGQGIGRAFVVRRIVQGEGVERVFPFHSPLIQDIEIQRKGTVRRAKLYDLRKKSGKSARIKERLGGMKVLAQELATEAADKAVLAEQAEAEAKAAAEAEARLAAKAAAEAAKAAEAEAAAAAAEAREAETAGAAAGDDAGEIKD